jgi:hypothetical protein
MSWLVGWFADSLVGWLAGWVLDWAQRRCGSASLVPVSVTSLESTTQLTLSKTNQTNQTN